MLNDALDSRQVLEGSYLDIKSTTMRDTLQKVREAVTSISLREDKPSVSTSLRMIATKWFSRRLCRINPDVLLIYLHHSHWPGRIGAVGRGRRGPQGVSGAQCGLRHDRVGRCRKVDGNCTTRSGEVIIRASGFMSVSDSLCHKQ